MKMTKLLFAPAMLLAIAISSCSNNDKNPVNPVNTATMQVMFQQLAETPQSFTVAAGTWQNISGARGTILRFNPQSFKDASGNIITSGTINIKLTEAYTPGQMILNGLNTTTEAHKLLSSGGSVNIVATLNQQEVFANNYSILFPQPAVSNDAMSLFKGSVTDALPGARKIWGDDTTATVPRTTKDSLVQDSPFYAFDTCVSFNWINCDHFYTAPDPKTDIKVVMPDTSYNATNTQVFVVFPAINSVASMGAYDVATHTFSFGYATYFLPVGTVIKIMVLGGKNDVYFMDKQANVSVTNGMTVTANPNTTTLGTIQTTLSTL
jgi:hypothetical protein